MRDLFNLGDFTLHSGDKSNWKINCDVLSDKDWECLAAIIASKFDFGLVVGVPTGGVKLAYALKPYTKDHHTCLIVDDVLTTGNSMEEMRQKQKTRAKTIQGVVVFARGKCPSWVTPIFQLWE